MEESNEEGGRCVCVLFPPDDISQTDPQVVADHPVHANLLVGAGVVRQHDTHGLSPLLPLHQHCVSAEELQLVHFRLHTVHGSSGIFLLI